MAAVTKSRRADFIEGLLRGGIEGTAMGGALVSHMDQSSIEGANPWIFLSFG
jgi:hypothetical protein